MGIFVGTTVLGFGVQDVVPEIYKFGPSILVQGVSGSGIAFGSVGAHGV